MNEIGLHKLISEIVWFLYKVRIWSRCDEDTVWERRIKLFYSFYYPLFPLSLLAGAISSDNQEEKIFLIESSLMTSVVLTKLLFLIWRKQKILEQLNRTCIHLIEDHRTFTFVKMKLQHFIKFVVIFMSAIYLGAICITVVLPFVGSEKSLFFKIGFPFDWRNNEFAYWTAFIFLFSQIIITCFSLFFTVFIWYLMFHCGLRYLVLGEEIKKMGTMKPVESRSKGIKRKATDAEKDNVFRQDLHEAIGRHQNLTKLKNQLDVFTAKVFAIQLATSGLSISGSVYRLAFDRGETLLEITVNLIIFLYNVFDIFMISYYGNEIKFWSDRLSYRLFESQWVDRSQLIKKEILIFGELLMKPVELVVLKLYPLTLETFTRIINSAYSMFNIAKNFK